MWGRGVFLVSFALVAFGTTTKCPKRRMSPVREIFCYTSSFDVQLLVDSVCSCTTLVHQNHDVRNFSISDIADLRKSLKEMYPPLQFVISINDPAKMLETSAMIRQETIARIIAIMKEVDGVEMNVTAGSKERLHNFIKSLKNEMTRKMYDKRIFLVLPSESENIAKQFDLKELIKYIDLFTLSTDYLTDEDGAFVTFHPSRLMGLFDMLNTDNLVDLISGLGVPKQKILITLPANAYKFTLKDEAENAPRSETTEKEPIPIDRKQLCEAINNGEWTVERDEDLTAPYAFQNKTWIAFEDKISVGIKGKYVLLRDLAGLAVRNIENDKKTECEEPLTQEIYHSFVEFRRKSRQAVLNALEDELHQMQFSYPNQAKTSSFRVVRVVDTEGHIRAVRESTQTEFVCRRQGYFVHPKSCNRFYRCVKFNQAVEDYSVFEFDCPAGLSFDERTEVCVWPGSLPEGSPCPGSSEIAPVAPKRFECSQPGYYADPQNCRWFFACMDLGESELMAFEFRCPYGLVFDEKKLVCEWPWLVSACSGSGSAYTRAEYDYKGHTAEISSVGVGGYVTGGLPEYSTTAGTSYSNVDYSKTTNTHGASYFGSNTGYFDGHGISTSGNKAISGYGLSSTAGVDYSKSHEHGGSVSSIPTYTDAHRINIGFVSPSINVAQGATGYSASSDTIGSTVSAGQPDTRYFVPTDGINTEYANTGSLQGISAGFPGSTTGQFAGTVQRGHTEKQGVTHFGTSGLSYSNSVGGYTGSVSTSNPTAGSVSYSKTPGASYPELPVGIHGGSAGPKYVGSTNVYADSGTFNTGSYSASTSKSGITSGISAASEYTGGIDNSHFVSGSTPYSGVTGTSTTRTRYNDEQGYTIPVFIQQEEPIYPSIKPTGGVRISGHIGTIRTSGGSATSSYEKTDFTRPHLNVSVFGSQIPTGYDIQRGTTGTILSGSSKEGSIFTGGSSSESAFSYGNIPGTISTPTVKQDVLTISGQPNYIATSSGTPGYVINNGVKTVESSHSLSYGTPTPAILFNGPSISDVILKGITPGVVVSGQTAPGISAGSSIQQGIIESSTDRAYVSQSDVTRHDIRGGEAATRGSVTYSSGTLSGGLKPTSSQGYKPDGEYSAAPYDTGKYTEKDIPDYRSSSSIFPDSIIQGNRIESNRGFSAGSTFTGAYDGPSTAAPGYSSTKSAVFTPSGFTKTGPTRTGITTAILGGGGSYSVSTGERRPTLNPENISEKAFQGNVGYTTSGYSYPKPSVQLGTSDATFSSTPISSTEINLPGSTAAPSRANLEPGTPGYSYPKPAIQLGTSDVTLSSAPISSTNFPIATPTPFLINVQNESLDVFKTKIPTVRPIIYTTEHPDIYGTTHFEAARIPTVRPVVDTDYKKIAVPTNIPVSVLHDFTQRIDGSQTASVSTSSSFQQTDSSGQKDYSSFTSSPPSLEYLPAQSTARPGAIASTTKYDIPTARPQPSIGVTYKRPSPVSDVTYKSPSPTTFRPYYSDQRFSTSPFLKTTSNDGSPTNLDIPRDKIDKMITNYGRGTVKYSPSVYDTYASSEFDSTSGNKFSTSLSSTKSSFSGQTGGTFAITTSSGLAPSSYEVTTKSPENKGKVIVKWSDLHPLLLGKLGAECTCKADPFATLRGPGKNLIASSRGKVDLANYDESEIYVDLENDSSSEEDDYITSYHDSSQPYKISPLETTTDSTNVPSSSYLPSLNVGRRNIAPAIDIRADAKSDTLRRSSGFQAGRRTGKKLEDEYSQNSASYEEDDPDQIIDGATNCARPGLFRHPNLCNKFYACHWDQWKKKFTLHIFNCPIHLTFDSSVSACNWPSKGPACQAGNLLV
ncbi:serine-rich adhesin for platelets [Linepithema humile]|uniref:serine-rich adhesin for platelets n=1 Tax=Linepithema humile TaxID=83485 RepID=UPI00351DF769